MEIRSIGNNAVAAVNLAERSAVKNAGAVKPATEEVPKQSLDLAVEEKTVEQTTSSAQLDQALSKINESLKSNMQGIEFSLDDDNGQVIVKVVDQDTKELIRQMPSKEALAIAKALDQAVGMLIKQTA